MKDELAKRVRIPYDFIVLGRELIKKVIPIRVSLEKPWLLDKLILKASLRQEVSPNEILQCLKQLVSSGSSLSGFFLNIQSFQDGL